MGNQEKNKPIKKIRVGAVTATIWNNTGKAKDGADIEYKTVVVERVYMDRNEKWQTTNNFRVNDLPKIELAARKSFEFLTAKDE